MFRRQRQAVAVALLASDLFITALGWFAAYVLRFYCWPAPQGIPQLSSVAALLPHVLALAVTAYFLCGLYHLFICCKKFSDIG